MHDPLDFAARPVYESLARKRRHARRMLTAEQLGLALWKPFFWAAGFAGIWLMEGQAALPPTLQIILSFIFFAGLITLLVRGLRRIEWPTAQDIDRRIEAASNVKHRPLALIGDKPASPPEPGSDASHLWKRARTRALDKVQKLKIPLPRALIAPRDPFALRLAAMLLLISGFAVAGADWQQRLKAGLMPIAALMPEGLPKTITLTFIPPAYTGQGQSVVSGPGWMQEPLTLPIGTVMKATALSSFGTPAFTLDDQSFPFIPQGQGSFTLEATITKGEKLGIRRFGLPVMNVPLSITHDTPPTVEAIISEDKKPFTILQDQTLRFALNAADDYGVKDLHMRMRLDPIIEEPPLGEAVADIRAITSPKGGKAQRTDPVYDFTSSPWAGLPAVVEFSVTDHAGQTGTMPPITLTLPEREFRHPVSQALIAQRKALIWAPMGEPSGIVVALEALLVNPKNFQGDQIAYLGIKVASARLKYARIFKTQSMENSRSVVDLLWDTALRIEDGNLSLAARNLRDAQRELENALRENKMSKEEMMKLTDKVRELLQQYLSEMQEELQKRIQNGEALPMIPPEMLTQQLDQDKLDSFMQQMLEEMTSGNTQKAQEMLSQLQKLLDSVNPSLAMPMPMDMQQMDQGISEMQQLIERQEELLAQTKLQAESAEAPLKSIENLQQLLQLEPEMLEKLTEQIPEAKVDTQSNKIEQDALRFVLGQLMLDAGEVFKDIPRNLGLAEMEMRESADQLGLNKPRLSVPHQEDTIKLLKEAQQQMQKELGEKMQQMMSGAGAPMFFSMPSFGNRQLDPLGRPLNDDPNGTPNSLYAPVEIPDEAERQRAEEIQKLLRDRAGELYRPADELNYFRRLLKQF